jgi:colanic acid biosynthesis glycosyl transferase WcaI
MSVASMINSPPSVLFVNRYFHPDHAATSQLLSDLAFSVAEQGDWQVMW